LLLENNHLSFISCQCQQSMSESETSEKEQYAYLAMTAEERVAKRRRRTEEKKLANHLWSEQAFLGYIQQWKFSHLDLQLQTDNEVEKEGEESLEEEWESPQGNPYAREIVFRGYPVRLAEDLGVANPKRLLSLPKWFAQSKVIGANVRELDLSFHRFQDLPEDLFLNFHRLEEFVLVSQPGDTEYGTSISALPPYLPQSLKGTHFNQLSLAKFNFLPLFCNRVIFISSFLFSFSFSSCLSSVLKVSNLHNLMSLPSSLSFCSSLSELWCNNCRLLSVPDLSACSDLCVLLINDNLIQHLPSFLLQIRMQVEAGRFQFSGYERVKEKKEKRRKKGQREERKRVCFFALVCLLLFLSLLCSLYFLSFFFCSHFTELFFLPLFTISLSFCFSFFIRNPLTYPPKDIVDQGLTLLLNWMQFNPMLPSTLKQEISKLYNNHSVCAFSDLQLPVKQSRMCLSFFLLFPSASCSVLSLF